MARTPLPRAPGQACTAAVLLAVGLLAVVADPGAALAQEVDSATQRNFQAQDLNGDGRIDLDEFGERYRNRFGRADANGDGALTADEMVAYYASHAASRTLGPLAERRYRARHEHQDSDGDGIVTLQEYLDFAAAVFAYMDQDKNGRMTVEEMAAAGKR